MAQDLLPLHLYLQLPLLLGLLTALPLLVPKTSMLLDNKPSSILFLRLSLHRLRLPRMMNIKFRLQLLITLGIDLPIRKMSSLNLLRLRKVKTLRRQQKSPTLLKIRNQKTSIAEFEL